VRSGVYDQIREVMPLKAVCRSSGCVSWAGEPGRGSTGICKCARRGKEEMLVRARVAEKNSAAGASPALRLPAVTAELHQQGMIVNHKRVERDPAEDNLLGLRYRNFVPHHRFPATDTRCI